MTIAMRDLPAAKVSEELARQGIPAEEKVAVVTKADLADLADRIRAEAIRRGMTEALFADLSGENPDGR